MGVSCSYAGVLRAGIEALAGKRRDHDIGYAPSTGEYVDRAGIVDFAQAALSDALQIAANFGAVLDHDVQEAAFGAPGEPGDPDRILHMSQRFLSVYEDFMDWSARLRGTAVQGDHARTALRALAQTADQNVEALSSFVEQFVIDCDSLLDRVDAGENVNLIVPIELNLDPDLMAEFNAELRLAVRRD